MKLKLFITIVITKFFIITCRLLKHGGTTFPGKIARLIYPNMLNVIASNLKIVFVTGTNGKTTTLGIIGQILKDANIKYISNKSGANLISGIFSAFIEHANLNGDINAEVALIEIDETTFPIMTDYLKPDILIVTNFFKDQLDRYTETFTPINRVKEGIIKCKDTLVVLNADDPLCTSLADATHKDAIFYGFEKLAYSGDKQLSNLNTAICTYCNNRLEYDFNTYEHLGGFKCSSCGYQKPEPHISVTEICEMNNDYSKICVQITNKSITPDTTITNNLFTTAVNLPGLYNIYNSLSAITCSIILNIPIDKIVQGLTHFESAFGRMETLKNKDKIIKLILVKNSTGFNQVLDYILTDSNSYPIAFLINDNPADGTDISWLWDVNFEKLETAKERATTFIASGTRAEDIAVRLKYANIPVDKIAIMNDYNSLLNISLEMLKPNETLYLLPNYTALLDIRKHLNNKFKIKKFWE